METSYSDANHFVLNAKITIGEVWDAERLVVLVLKPLFCMQKPQMRAGPIEIRNFDAKVALLNAQNHG